MKIRRKQLSYQNLPDCLEQFLICDSFVYKTFTNPVHKDKFNMTGFHFLSFLLLPGHPRHSVNQQKEEDYKNGTLF